jgi:cellulose synthase/poly-beta-1,6-N-acetylglucosamine synthase-like glycosyltransferase
MTLLFWGCAGFVAYVYVGFPLLTILRGRLWPRPYRLADIEPDVSLLVAAHNEAGVIEEKIRNALALDYPPDRLEIVVVSDGSDDGTNEIVQRHANGRVRLLALERVGKPEALNAAVAASRGEILVFSDANSMYRPDAIRALVRPFADPDVGGVAGNQVYLPPAASDAGDASMVGEQQYWDFDRALKTAQSRAGSVCGATGAIYAMRRPHFAPLRADVSNDDLLNSLRIVAQRRRLVFERDAIAYEHVPETVEVTFPRRVRVMVGGLHCIVVMRDLLNPLHYGFFAIQLLTHKLLLRTMVMPLMALAVISPLLWARGWPYQVATLGQAALYALGVVGIALRGRPIAKHRLLALPAFFCLINAAAAKAMWDIVRGERYERWEPARAPKR